EKVIRTAVGINFQNKAGVTTIGLAASLQQVSQVRVLIDSDAAITLKDSEGQNVLTLAIRADELHKEEINLQDLRKTERIVKMLLKESSKAEKFLLNDSDKQLRTPLMYAASTGNFLVVETLIKQGADVNRQDDAGMSVLHLAI